MADKLDLRMSRRPSWLNPDEVKARAGEYIDRLTTALGDYNREEKERSREEREKEREKKREKKERARKKP